MMVSFWTEKAGSSRDKTALQNDKARRCPDSIAQDSPRHPGFAAQRYGKNIFMQKQLPPAFSNSEVSTTMGFNFSSLRIASNCGVM